MIKICKYNQENVLVQIRHGKLDAIALSTSNIIDDIIRTSSFIYICQELFYFANGSFFDSLLSD